MRDKVKDVIAWTIFGGVTGAFVATLNDATSTGAVVAIGIVGAIIGGAVGVAHNL